MVTAWLMMRKGGMLTNTGDPLSPLIESASTK